MEVDIKADIDVADTGKQVSLMEPSRIGDGYRFRARITDLEGLMQPDRLRTRILIPCRRGTHQRGEA